MDQQFPFFSLLLSFVLFTFTVLKIWRKSKTKDDSISNLPPGPKKFPIIGNIHQMGSAPPHQRLRDLAKIYGPVMHLQFGEISTVVVSLPEAAKEVLKVHDVNFADKPCLYVANAIFYGSKDIFFAPYGDSWRQLRKICVLELLSAKRVRLFKSIREDEVSNLIASIISTDNGVPINLSKMMASLSNAIIARASIGKKSKNQDAFLPILEDVIRAGAGFNIVDIFPSIKLFRFISWTGYKVKMAHQKADKFLDAIINERRAESVEAKNSGGDDMEDLLDVLLNLTNDGNFEYPITTENIKAIILDMFGAGSDTSLIVLEWTMSELMKNPEIMRKAQKEVREVFSGVGNVDEARLHELQFLKLVIKESMRLHPPLVLIPRQCREKCKINGYDIDEKTKILINVWAIGKDPEHWIDAEKFYPERFLASSIDYKGSNFEFIPFGAGKRICPGMLFGMTTVEFTLAKLLYHFDWKLPNGLMPENLDMTEAFTSAVGRKHALTLIPIPYYPSKNIVA